MLQKLTAKVIAYIVGGVLLVGLILFAVNSCNSGKQAKKQAEVSSEQGNASISAGAEAVNTVGNVASSDAETDAIVAGGQAEIRAAVAGQKGAAAKRAACRLKAYRDTPQCKEPTP